MKKFRKKCLVEIGQRLKEAREADGLSLNYISYGYELSLSTLSRLERGETIPNLLTLMKYAVVLKVSLVDLFDGIEFVEEV